MLRWWIKLTVFVPCSLPLFVTSRPLDSRIVILLEVTVNAREVESDGHGTIFAISAPPLGLRWGRSSRTGVTHGLDVEKLLGKVGRVFSFRKERWVRIFQISRGGAVVSIRYVNWVRAEERMIVMLWIFEDSSPFLYSNGHSHRGQFGAKNS